MVISTSSLFFSFVLHYCYQETFNLKLVGFYFGSRNTLLSAVIKHGHLTKTKNIILLGVKHIANWL